MSTCFSSGAACSDRSPTTVQVSTNAVWEGTARTVRWGLEVDGEQQPEERIGMLPLGRSQLHLDPKIIRDNKLVSTQADVRQAQVRLAPK
jgi:hypothetical protein